MRNLLATAAAGVAVVLVVGALVAMAAESLGVAGFSFLCASLVIYFRETRLLAS